MPAMHAEGINKLEHTYSDHSLENKAYLLLHGVRGGIDEAYIQTLLQKIIARDDAVLAFNFPYMTRGEGAASGAALREETDALQVAYDFLKTEGKARIHIIAKSLGGIVVSHWLTRSPDVEGVEVSIMGYIPGEGGIIPDALRDRLKLVVQGEHDKYGNADSVRAELLAHQVGGEVIEIPNADHSYRDIANLGVHIYPHQEKAIDELLMRI
jgi:predicted alpha/beta-hydrolase family hydrolase